MISGTDDTRNSVQKLAESDEHVVKERSKKSKGKRKKRFTDMDTETSGESGIELSDSEEESEKGECNEVSTCRLVAVTALN